MESSNVMTTTVLTGENHGNLKFEHQESECQNEKDNNNKTDLDYDQIINSVHHFGKFQKIQLLILSIGIFITGMIEYLPVFILKIPDHRCLVENLENDERQFYNLSRREVVDLAIPLKDNQDVCENQDQMIKAENVEQCSEYEVDWPEYQSSIFYDFDELARLKNSSINSTISCRSESYLIDNSVVENSIYTQFNLMCQKSGKFLIAVTQICYNLGSAIAVYVAPIIADKFGRIRCSNILMPVIIFSLVGLIFSPNVYVFMFFFLFLASAKAKFDPDYLYLFEITVFGS